MNWEFTPDRRPVVIVPLWTGGFTQNDLGLDFFWYDSDLEDPCGSGTDTSPANSIPDVFERLLIMLNRLYDDGYRRIVLNMPAGTPAGQTFYSSAQWHTMPEWRREGFEDYIAPWIAAKAIAEDPVNLGIYAGYRIDDPCSHDTTNVAYPDLEDSSDVCTVYQNLQPWIDLGFAEYWFDASAGGPAFITLQHSADYSGILKLGGEAIPTQCLRQCEKTPSTPEMSKIESMAFVALFTVIYSNFGLTTTFDPNTTEIGVMMTGHPITCLGDRLNTTFTFEEAVQLYQNGYVLWVESRYNSSVSFEYSFRRPEELARRIYNFGPLTSMIDMNNDGYLDVSSTSDTDYDLFLTAYYTNTGNPGGYLDGDVNGDGDVDVLDLLDFIDAVDQWDTSSIVVPTNLGDPWWVP